MRKSLVLLLTLMTTAAIAAILLVSGQIVTTATAPDSTQDLGLTITSTPADFMDSLKTTSPAISTRATKAILDANETMTTTLYSQEGSVVTANLDAAFEEAYRTDRTTWTAASADTGAFEYTIATTAQIGDPKAMKANYDVHMTATRTATEHLEGEAIAHRTDRTCFVAGPTLSLDTTYVYTAVEPATEISVASTIPDVATVIIGDCPAPAHHIA